MFTKLMYWIVSKIAWLHDWLGDANDSLHLPLNDKQLHFVIIGLVGLLMIFVVGRVRPVKMLLSVDGAMCMNPAKTC